MGALVSHDLTVEDLGAAMWALDIAPRFGLVFHWSDGVRVRGWSALAPSERAPFEACKPAIRALLTPDASGKAGVDYIRVLEPAPEETILKPSLADKIAAAALDHRGDPATREIAWRKLHEGGALKPMEPRLPPPPKAEPQRPSWGAGWQSRQPDPPPRRHEWRPEPKPKKPPAGCDDWSEAWLRFRHKANWTGDRGNRTTTLWGFRVIVHGAVSKRSGVFEWGWFVEAPDGETKSGAGARHEFSGNRRGVAVDAEGMAMKRNVYRQKRDEEDAADAAMATVDPEASDQIIAETVAEYLVAQLPSSRLYHLSIIHEVRPREIRRLERIRERNPDYEAGEPTGPCPVPYNWQNKNVVGVSTHDRDRAKRWAIDAALAGYCVFRSFRRYGSGGGQGSLAEIRERRRAEIQRETSLQMKRAAAH